MLHGTGSSRVFCTHIHTYSWQFISGYAANFRPLIKHFATVQHRRGARGLGDGFALEGFAGVCASASALKNFCLSKTFTVMNHSIVISAPGLATPSYGPPSPSLSSNFVSLTNPVETSARQWNDNLPKTSRNNETFVFPGTPPAPPPLFSFSAFPWCGRVVYTPLRWG